jgi:hypothetical protein
MKSVKYDFYRVQTPENQSLVAMLNDIYSKEYESRTIEINGYPVCLDQLGSAGNGKVSGLLVKVRMDGIPPKTNIKTGAKSDIDLMDDEGLGEDTVFVYDPSLSVLVLQRNRTGITASQLAKYLYNNCDLDGEVALLPILVEGAYQRLAQFGVFRKLRVKVAPLISNEIFRGGGHSVGKLIDLSRDFESPVIDISFCMGRAKKGTLLPESIRGMVDSLLAIREQNSDAVTNIEITGKDSEDSESSFIDLIEERMVEEADVALNDKRQIDIQGRYSAGLDALRRRRAELRRLLVIEQ